MLEFYNLKSYLINGAVPMRGVMHETHKGVIVGMECEGKKMSAYLYFKGEWCFKSDLVKATNIIVNKELRYLKKEIRKMEKKINKPKILK